MEGGERNDTKCKIKDYLFILIRCPVFEEIGKMHFNVKPKLIIIIISIIIIFIINLYYLMQFVRMRIISSISIALPLGVYSLIRLVHLLSVVLAILFWSGDHFNGILHSSFSTDFYVWGPITQWQSPRRLLHCTLSYSNFFLQFVLSVLNILHDMLVLAGHIGWKLFSSNKLEESIYKRREVFKKRPTLISFHERDVYKQFFPSTNYLYA